MSEEQMEQQEHSAEEKFFGVKTVIGKKPDDEGQDPDIDVEVVDDRPPEDRRPPAKEAKPEPSDDEELEGYSDKVKKRINKLRYQQHEERRQREEAERLREEAIRVAQKYADQSKQYHKIIQEGEQYLVHQIRERASMAVDQAKNSYRQAYEEGNTDKILEAQEAMINAQSELKSADYQLNEIKARPKQAPEEFKPPEPEKPQVHQPPEPSAKALKWFRAAAAQNHAPSLYNLATAYAFGTGVPRDADEASALYRRAAMLGSADAAYALGRLEPDLVAAREYFVVAARRGHRLAAAALRGEI